MVTVRAHELFNLPPTDANIDALTVLTDDEGYECQYGAKNMDFETIVYHDKDVIWDITTADPNGEDHDYTVALVSVEHKDIPNNAHFFGSGPLFPSEDGTIKGQILDNPDTPELEDIYNINFTIKHNSITRAFPLDPKLRVNTML